MGAMLRSVEVEAETAAALEEKAESFGVSVATLLAEWLAADELAPRDDPDAIVELDRRWQAADRGAKTVAREDAERWLKTWGTPSFRRWPVK